MPAVADTTTVSSDLARSGWDPNEPGLGPSQVSAADFGQQFDVTVDGSVYAQPLVVGNTVVVTTERAKAYGIDATTGAILWQRSFGSPFQSSTIGCGDLTPDLGSTSTPVYDPASGTVYLTTKIADGATPQQPHWYLQAISITDGSERPGFPVTIQGQAANDSSVTFDPYVEMQRPGLLLSGGVVYAGFGAHCDIGAFRGWVAAVKVTGSTPSVQSMWTAENSSASDGAGIWQSGGGLVSDGNDSYGPRIFLATGNGLSPPAGPGNTPPGVLGDSVVRLGLDSSGQLVARDFFSPSNAPTLDVNDTDLGSGGPAALPDSFGTPTHPHLLVEQGKDGRVFLLDRDQLGGRQQGPGGTDAVVQTLGPFRGVWGHPAVYGGEGGWLYIVESSGGPLRAYSHSVTSAGDPALSAVGASVEHYPFGSGSPIVTSDGTTPGSALVWVIYVSGGTGTSAELRAYDAVPVNGVMNLRWSAPIGTASKFSMPATGGGHIFVGTRDGHVLAFGQPSASALSGQLVDFGQAAVGSTATAIAHLVASKPITVQSVSTAAPFAADASGLGLPKTLAAGGTLDVPVTFQPTSVGSVTGSLNVATDVGTVGVGLHGVGTQTGLTASPSPVDFGTVATGTSKSLTVTVANSGTASETVSGVVAPSAPFTAQNLPTSGTVIGPQQSLAVSITYTPTAAGSDSGSFAITTGSGTLNVPLSASAITGQGHLTLTPTTLDFGSVTVSTSKTLTFDVSNTGNIPITITKAKAPSGVFTATNPLPEGLSIPAGDVFHQQVTFTPTASGSATASYNITADDGQGTLTVTLTGTGAAPPPPPAPGPAPGAGASSAPVVDRLAGPDRYATAVAISQATFSPGVSDVIVATGQDFPDALAGAAVAGAEGVPVLLVPAGSVPAEVQAELTRLKPARITIVGGTGAVSSASAAQLAAYAPTVRRLQGPDRYATAVAVSAATFQPGVADAFIATGLDFPDALAAAAAAGHLHAPVLLVPPDQLPGEVVNELVRLRPGQITVVGGAGAVSAAVESQLHSYTSTVRRLAGADRYATAAAVATAVFPGAAHVFLASGLTFPDALSGAPVAALAPGPLLLSETSCIPSTAGSTGSVLTQLGPSRVTLLGGTAVLGQPVAALTPCS